ncbi:MAG: putative toxin-antitoxin system toxin component, PIN family, partial [Pyrinomonadaceae bacterium]
AMKLIVIDTNVWVSAFLNRTGFPARIKDAWVNGKFEIAISTPLLHEINEVLHRPRLKNKYVTVLHFLEKLAAEGA